MTDCTLELTIDRMDEHSSLKLVRVAKYLSVEEATLATNLLGAHDIESALMDEHAGWQVYLAGAASGVWLATLEADAERAMKLLRSVAEEGSSFAVAAKEARTKLLRAIGISATIGLTVGFLTDKWLDVGPIALLSLMVILLVLPSIRIVWTAIFGHKWRHRKSTGRGND